MIYKNFKKINKKMINIFVILFLFLNFNFSNAEISQIVSSSTSVYVSERTNINITNFYYTKAIEKRQFRFYVKFKNNSDKDFKGYVDMLCSGKIFGGDQVISISKYSDTDTVFFDGTIFASGKIFCILSLKDENAEVLDTFKLPIEVLKDTVVQNLNSDSSQNNNSNADSNNNLNNGTNNSQNNNNNNNTDSNNQSINNVDNNNSGWLEKSRQFLSNTWDGIKDFFTKNNSSNNEDNNGYENISKNIASSTAGEKNKNTSKVEPASNASNSKITKLKSGVFLKDLDKDNDGILDSEEAGYGLNNSNPNTFFIPDGISLYLIKYWYILLIGAISSVMFIKK